MDRKRLVISLAAILAGLAFLAGVAVRLAVAEDEAARAVSTVRPLPVPPQSLKPEFRHV